MYEIESTIVVFQFFWHFLKMLSNKFAVSDECYFTVWSRLAFWILEWNKIVIKQEIGPIGLFCYITRCFCINQSMFLILPHCAIWGEWCDGTSKEREHTYKEPFFMVMVFELGYYTNIRKYFVYLHCTFRCIYLGRWYYIQNLNIWSSKINVGFYWNGKVSNTY